MPVDSGSHKHQHATAPDRLASTDETDRQTGFYQTDRQTIRYGNKYGVIGKFSASGGGGSTHLLQKK